MAYQHSATILHVDFHTGHIVGTDGGGWEKYTWKCDCCGNRYTYDSRKENNVKRIDSRVSICHHCINMSYQLLNGGDEDGES